MNAHSVVNQLFNKVWLANLYITYTLAMKSQTPTDLILAPEVEAIVEDRLLAMPRPSVDRERLQHHLREALKLLHVDMEDENIRDTPRRWADSLVTMTSGYDYTDLKKLT